MTTRKYAGQIRIKKRAEDNKKYIERANKNPIKPSNMYTVLMDEGVKNEEKEMEKITNKKAKKEVKK